MRRNGAVTAKEKNTVYDKANYFAILPAAVRYDRRLSARAVLLYAALSSLAAADGTAFASNAYLAETLDVSTSTVKRLLSELETQNHISIGFDYIDGTKEIARRRIRITGTAPLLLAPLSQALFAVVPSHILAVRSLSVQAKLLYAEISAATPVNGFCSKPATFFAELMGMGASTVRRLIKELVDVDALRVEMEYKGDTREIRHRRIYLTEAAAIAEKRADLASDGSGDALSGTELTERETSNTPENGRIRGMLIFEPTSQKQNLPPRKLRRKRKKAAEILRL